MYIQNKQKGQHAPQPQSNRCAFDRRLKRLLLSSVHQTQRSRQHVPTLTLTLTTVIDLALGIAIPDLNFQSRDSGLSNSQSRDPVGIGVV